jgi:hypothetical protein
MVTYTIDSYAVRLWSSRPTTATDPTLPVAAVSLYERGTPRGRAAFYPDGTPLAPPLIDAGAGRVELHLTLSQLEAVLQLLREEQPIYLYEQGPTDAGLATGQEPTGEEEGPGG